MTYRNTRRATLKAVPYLAAAAALAVRRTVAAEEKLDVADPQAVALGYVEHSSQVNAAKYPGFVPGSNCDNCLQLQGKAGPTYRPCGLFAGKLVSVDGWCSGWTAKI